ncbi:uncharacterized protein Smp_201600 [Schistosoma mansoni]|uniref:Smp_201600 n=1 Tax=Schistosoma mansoni TaxID=6183 RepID=G4VCZ2_SCHMA|nr:uncharacterized protein Smp_201600 [Schistosoma mansoni]|eukprot:XP_018650386.1 uncharacterized protein Smp_201600 [Schistosoma mansoni]
MNKLSLIQLFIIILVTLTIKINGDNTDTYDKRASLAYFKRRSELSDSPSSLSLSPSSSSKRASLSYFKRGQYDQRFEGIHHIRQIIEICPCLNKDYLHWLEENLLLNKHTTNTNDDDNLELEKRASLSYF